MVLTCGVLLQQRAHRSSLRRLLSLIYTVSRPKVNSAIISATTLVIMQARARPRPTVCVLSTSRTVSVTVIVPLNVSLSGSALPFIQSMLIVRFSFQGERRYRGCDCVSHRRASKYQVCDSDRCPCVRAGRECDPELCVPCMPRCGLLYLYILLAV